MKDSPAMLSYAGPPPAAEKRSIPYRCWRGLVWLVTMLILIVFVTVRTAILLAGFVLVILGTILLVLGGKRGAAEKLAQWREHTIDLLRLWRSDIARFFRRRSAPLPPVAVPVAVPVAS